MLNKHFEKKITKSNSGMLMQKKIHERFYSRHCPLKIHYMWRKLDTIWSDFNLKFFITLSGVSICCHRFFTWEPDIEELRWYLTTTNLNKSEYCHYFLNNEWKIYIYHITQMLRKQTKIISINGLYINFYLSCISKHLLFFVR